MRFLIKNSFALLFFVFAFQQMNAQVSFGLKGGVNLSKQVFEGNALNVTSDKITGYSIGALLEVPLMGPLYLQPEFLISKKGSELKLQNIKTELNYIDVPVLLKAKVVNTDMVNVNIIAGPSFGYATNGEVRDSSTTIDIKFGKDNTKRFDVGLNLGGGVGVNFGRVGLFGDLRYLLGVSDVSNVANASVKNKGFSASVGLMFRLFGE